MDRFLFYRSNFCQAHPYPNYKGCKHNFPERHRRCMRVMKKKIRNAPTSSPTKRCSALDAPHVVAARSLVNGHSTVWTGLRIFFQEGNAQNVVRRAGVRASVCRGSRTFTAAANRAPALRTAVRGSGDQASAPVAGARAHQPAISLTIPTGLRAVEIRFWKTLVA